jgi:hypothetical protein
LFQVDLNGSRGWPKEVSYDYCKKIVARAKESREQLQQIIIMQQKKENKNA